MDTHLQPAFQRALMAWRLRHRAPGTPLSGAPRSPAPGAPPRPGPPDNGSRGPASLSGSAQIRNTQRPAVTAVDEPAMLQRQTLGRGQGQLRQLDNLDK